MLFDAHNHLQDDWLAPHLDRIAADLAALPLGGAVVNGTNEADWPAVTAIAARFPWVHASYGLHPWDVGNAASGWRDTLRRTLDAHPRAAVGEIGLDRWILDRARPDDPRLAGLRRAPLEEQTEACRWQLELATERNLPVTIHCLEAWGPLLELLTSTALPARGFLLHAYSGAAEVVPRLAALGAYFSFNGSFLAATGSRAERVHKAFRAIPPDRLLVETDAPAMPLPAERRTHALPTAPSGAVINHPANLAAAYAGLAEIVSQSPPALIERVAENFRRLFLTGPG